MLESGSLMFAMFFPVFMLKIRIERSFKTTARYFPFGLIFMLIGIELADKSFRNYVSILHEYFRFVGKSNV